MSLTKYETFLEVVKTGSMSKAAYNLHQTVPGISYTITKLEEEWGISLFNRNRNKLVITEEGALLAGYVSDVLEAQKHLDEALMTIKGATQGTVRVGGLRWAGQQWLPGIMKLMEQQCPGIEIKIVLNLYEEIKKDIMSGELDVAFAQEPMSKMLDYVHLVEDPYMAVTQKGHVLAKSVSVSLKQLDGYTLILPEWSYDKRMNLLIDQSGIRDKVSYFIKDTGTIVSMAAHGIGVAILPQYLLKDYPWEVEAVRLADWPARNVGLVMSALKKPSPATKKFIEYTQLWFQKKCLNNL